MNFYAQAGQDRYCCRLLGHAPRIERNFLDVGCAGLSISNTLGLEEIGWSGWLVDNSVEAMKASMGRKAAFIFADASQLDYSFLPPIVSYLSLDVDQYSLASLRKIFETAKTRFRVITAEHDSYSRGETLRTPMLELLKDNGYDILCADVCNPDPFEIWAIDPKLVDMTIAEQFRRNYATHWKEIGRWE